MRHFLIPVLLLGLLAGCSGMKLGPHRIDVQQGNALDQENVARLKPGLSRSQVRFLLGTPLLVDPFRSDRWDYVYVYYKAGTLAEQKRISLFFDGETLARIEGDVPATVMQEAASPKVAEPQSAAMPAATAAQLEPAGAAPRPAPGVEPAAVAAQPAVAPAVREAAPSAERAAARPVPGSSVVAPLPSPTNAPPYVEPRPVAELSLQPESDVERIRPDVIPPFPEPHPAQGGTDDPVLKAVNDWAAAWTRQDEKAYLAAYDADFEPQGGGSRSDWEKRRRLLLGMARQVEVRVDAPVVERAADGSATVTFNQYYRSDTYRDAVVKQFRMVERKGRWLIAEEKVLSVLRGSQR